MTEQSPKKRTVRHTAAAATLVACVGLTLWILHASPALNAQGSSDNGTATPAESATPAATAPAAAAASDTISTTTSTAAGVGTASPSTPAPAPAESLPASAKNVSAHTVTLKTEEKTVAAPPTSKTDKPSSHDLDTVEEGDAGGKLPVRFSLNFESVYDDNIYIRNQQQVGDFYWLINPGITYESGDVADQPDNFIRVWYKPKIYQFLDEIKNNSFDQDLRFDYQAFLGHLALGVTQTYVTDSTPSTDLGGRLNAEYYRTRLFANYEATGRLTWENEATQTLSSFDNPGTIDNNEWTVSSYLNYAAFPKTNFALGGTAGYLVLYQHPDQFYEQVNFKATYEATGKIKLNARIGAEYRQFEHSDQTILSPTFAFGGEYNPTDSTVLKFEGVGRTVPSISRVNQDYQSYGVNTNLRQRFLQHYYLGLNAGYYHSIYFYTPSATSTGLTYDYITLRPSVEWELNNYLTFGAYYQHQENIGSQNDQSYQSNQVGLQGSFKY